MTDNKTRMTKSKMYADILSLLNGMEPEFGSTAETASEFIRKEMEMLAKKNASRSDKPTAAQAANEAYKTKILDFLATQEKPVTCTEIKNAIPDLAIFENQKVAALLRQLKEAQKVGKDIVKGKSVFWLAQEGE